jgi:hypothetical protein
MQLSIGIFEELILPTVRAIENELYPGAGGATKSRIYGQLRELIEEMTVETPTESEQPSEQSTSGQAGIAIKPKIDRFFSLRVYRYLVFFPSFLLEP